MFDFIAFAYVILFPILFVLTFFLEKEARKKAYRFFAAINLSMIVYSLYVVKQVIGLYQIARQLGIPPMIQNAPANYMAKLALVVVLPFLFLKRSWMTHRIIAAAVWVLAIVLKTYRLSNFELQPVWVLFAFYGILVAGIFKLLQLSKKFPEPLLS